MRKDTKENNTTRGGKTIRIKRKVSKGPITDFHEHLPSQWWRDLFNAYYLKTDGDVVEDNRITSEEVDRVEAILQPKKESAILDLCCGQGRHILELARRGYQHLEGLDRSNYLIRVAKRRRDKEKLLIRFREGDVRKTPYKEDHFDIVLLMGNSMGYFEKIEEDIQVLRECFRLLKPSGKIFLDLADGAYQREHFQRRSWEWLDGSHLVCRERSLSKDGDRLISREVIVQDEKGVIVDQFYAERLYDTTSLKVLLEEGGFEKISFETEIGTPSERAQDLGMMEKRLLVTASIPSFAKVKRTHKKTKQEAMVVLVDPRQADPVKRNGKFNFGS